jgi:hypothetical protein
MINPPRKDTKDGYTVLKEGSVGKWLFRRLRTK